MFFSIVLMRPSQLSQRCPHLSLILSSLCVISTDICSIYRNSLSMPADGREWGGGGGVDPLGRQQKNCVGLFQYNHFRSLLSTVLSPYLFHLYSSEVGPLLLYKSLSAELDTVRFLRYKLYIEKQRKKERKKKKEKGELMRKEENKRERTNKKKRDKRKRIKGRVTDREI
jgi:hypothetical protein